MMTRRKLVLGLTGGIASGKTEVLRQLGRFGIPTISSDTLAHQCVRRGHASYEQIVRHFGSSILDANRQINRKRLAAIVFSNPSQRKRLEKIVHPCVVKSLRQFVLRHRGIVVLDIPLLFEAHLTRMVDKILVVACAPSIQIRRLRKRNGLSRAQALARIRSQLPMAYKKARADFVINNSSTLQQLHKHVRSILNQLDR
jgi:dephospho-CoA kinase